MQRDIQRFVDDSGFNRLDGSVRGWSVLGGATILSHVAVRVETYRQGELGNEQSFTVDIDGRLAAIRSRLAYHTRSSSAMGGFTHALSSRVRLAYLAGVTFTRVERTFTTNAPGLTLLPGTAPADTATARLVDDFPTVIVGVDAVVSLARHIAVVTGFRRQPLDLDVDITGYSIWPYVGGAWMF